MWICHLQTAYEEALIPLFDTLDWLKLSESRYLLGNQITEADWRLFTTLIRFDIVYNGHFKCNLRLIEDYPNLSNYLRDLYQNPELRRRLISTYKDHYYISHKTINPSGVVPTGPIIDYTLPNNRVI